MMFENIKNVIDDFWIVLHKLSNFMIGCSSTKSYIGILPYLQNGKAVSIPFHPIASLLFGSNQAILKYYEFSI
jgi:hypothetical protein